MDEQSHFTPAPATTHRWLRPASRLFGWLVFLILSLYFFNAVSTVVLGVLAATIVANTLSPLMRYLPGPRGVAAGLLGVILIAMAGATVLALSWPLAQPIRNEIAHWPQTQSRINTMLTKVSVELRLKEPMTVESIMLVLGNFLAGEGGRNLFSRSADVSLSILLWLVFIFIGSIFLLAERPTLLIQPAISLFPTHQREPLVQMLDDLGPRLRRWVVGTLISMTIVFTASLVGYLTIGLEFALPLALLAGLCEIVPTVGPATAVVVAATLAAATSGTGKLVGVAVVYAIIQSIEAYVVLPTIMRGAVSIHPAVTLFSVVLWGKIFGVPGLVLAIPINLTLWAIASRFLIDPEDIA